MKWTLIICLLLLSSLHSAQDNLINYNKDNVLTSNEITATFIDSKGIVWIGTAKGLNAFTDGKWFQISHIDNNETGKSSALEKVETIFEDRKQRLWVSSRTGMYLYNREYWIGFLNATDLEHTVSLFYEDRRGWLWLVQEDFENFVKEMGMILANGTIHMFNGYSWFEYDSVVAGTAGLINTRKDLYFFTDFLEAKNGDIWVSSLDGLFRFDGVKWDDYYEFDSKAVKTYDIMEGNDQDIWVASEYGISRYADGKWTNFSRKDGLSNSYYDILQQDPENRIWAFTSRNYSFNGLNMYDGEKWHEFMSKDLHIKGAVNELIFFENKVFAFSSSGLSRYNGSKWISFNRESGLKDKKYDIIEKDENNTIWLAGKKRLYRYNGTRWETLFEPDDDWQVDIIFIDTRQLCWIGTKKNGIYRQLHDNSWIHYTENNGLINNHINNIFEDKTGNIWIVTTDGLSVFFKNKIK